VLTEAGWKLGPIVAAIPLWGVRRVGDLGDAGPDPGHVRRTLPAWFTLARYATAARPA
jgi:hypothetical protein